MTRNLLVLGLFVSILSCAWWQKNESKIECAGIQTVTDAPELYSIVIRCAAEATTPMGVLSCVQGMAGSKWASDVIACFEGSIAGLTSCPAVPVKLASPMTSESRTRLREAVKAQGLQFAP